MGSKPKQQDYQASAGEKASAAVAMAEHKFFKENYDPLLKSMRDKSLTDNTTQTLRGRANADTMQALTKPSADRALSGANGGDMAQAYQGQLGIANTSGKDIQNKMQTNVLGTARGQAADAQTGMAQASNLATSAALTRAKAKQDVADAKMSAVGQLAGSFLAQGLDNMGTKGTKEGAMPKGQSGPGQQETVRGGFLSPVNSDGQKVTGAKNRLGYANIFGRSS
tara:strand:- start:1544 stop:2215 length:672 start_codon:yes stop_codon:yes gene_type:complete